LREVRKTKNAAGRDKLGDLFRRQRKRAFSNA
jgi:hypothetical protein